MVQMSVVYQGEKHCEITHGPSGSKIETDAPKDNQGKGERFSPTDLLGAALGSCILTTMAIASEKDGVQLKGARIEVAKVMQDKPRKIAQLILKIQMPGGIPLDRRGFLEAIVKACPVHRSLSSEMDIPVEIHYPD